jgi:DNA-binding Lrp family transcriptional regulator
VSNQIRLDRLDREILFQLRQYGRLSNVELARRVGLTPPPCLRRVKRLEDAGVIAGYRAVVDPAAIGRGLEVFVDVDINANDLKTVREFETTTAGYEEVVELRRMFGHPDYFLRVTVADHAAYEAFLTGKLIGLPGVLHVTSHLTMKTIKTTG